MRLVDADFLKITLYEISDEIITRHSSYDRETCEWTLSRVRKTIDELTVATDTEVKHGSWQRVRFENTPILAICKLCNKSMIWTVEKRTPDFCPYCGARMDEEVQK